MNRRYTDFQLQVICDLILLYGHLYYSLGAVLENEYQKRANDWRSSGALYMVAWRIEQGLYEHRGITV